MSQVPSLNKRESSLSFRSPRRSELAHVPSHWAGGEDEFRRKLLQQGKQALCVHHRPSLCTLWTWFQSLISILPKNSGKEGRSRLRRQVPQGTAVSSPPAWGGGGNGVAAARPTLRRLLLHAMSLLSQSRLSRALWFSCPDVEIVTLTPSHTRMSAHAHTLLVGITAPLSVLQSYVHFECMCGSQAWAAKIHYRKCNTSCQCGSEYHLGLCVAGSLFPEVFILFLLHVASPGRGVQTPLWPQLMHF